MAVFRVEKTKDFTVMCNHHLRDVSLSLKAEGLHSLMLSLPENWDYTTKGLAHICKDGVDSISTALKELEQHGYLTRQRLRNGNGQLGDIEYIIHEIPVPVKSDESAPKRENPGQGKPGQEKPEQAKPVQENPAQLNTNPLNTDRIKYGEKKEPRRQYGAYGNVLFTDSEFEKLRAEFPSDYQQRIECLSEYIASTGKQYKNHLATLRSWARRDVKKPMTGYSHSNYTFEEGDSL